MHESSRTRDFQLPSVTLTDLKLHDLDNPTKYDNLFLKKMTIYNSL